MSTALQASAAGDSEGSAPSAKVHGQRKQVGETCRGVDQIKLGLAPIIANTFHELRSPLHGMRGFIKLMLDGKVPDPETQREFLTIVDEQSRHLSNLVSDILDSADIESGQMVFGRQPVSMDEVIDEAVAKLQKPAQEKQIAIETSLTGTPRNIQGDFGKLEQAVANLLSSAIKFSPEQGRILVAAGAENNRVFVQVVGQDIDTPVNAVTRLFQKSSQEGGSMAWTDGGMSLGLYLAKQIIEAHSGQIWVASEQGKGTAFSFAIPTSTDHTSQTRHREDAMGEDASGHGPAAEGTGQAIPVPEDDVKNRERNGPNRRPLSLKDKSLLLRLDEPEWNAILSASFHLGITPPLLARVLLKQAISRYSRQKRLDDLFLLSTSPVPATTPLSRREMEILNLMAQGLSNGDIADIFHLDERTIKNHVTSILRKLDANNRTQAVVLALRHNLIEPDILGGQEVSTARSSPRRKAEKRIRMNDCAKCVGAGGL